MQVPTLLVSEHGLVWPEDTTVQSQVPEVGWHCLTKELPWLSVPSAQR
jgi:hypothetical protein